MATYVIKAPLGYYLMGPSKAGPPGTMWATSKKDARRYLTREDAEAAICLYRFDNARIVKLVPNRKTAARKALLDVALGYGSGTRNLGQLADRAVGYWSACNGSPGN